MQKLLRIVVSFKKTTKDMKLYTYVNALEEKSDFVKKSLEFYINHLEKETDNGSVCNR